jgi:hypothetical protein
MPASLSSILVLLTAAVAFGAVPITLDGAGGTGGRTLHDIGPKSAAATFGGSLHLFSYDATGGNLRWGRRTGSTWTFRTLDGAGGASGRIDANVGEDQATLVYGGKLHVFYYDATHGDLRHAMYDGTGWTFQTLDGQPGSRGRIDAQVGLRPSAVNFGGKLHVAYVNSGAGDLRHAVFDGTRWTFGTLDGAGGPSGRIDGNVGWNTALSVYGSALHIFYLFRVPPCPSCDFRGSLREATFAGGAWTFSTLRDIGCCHVDQSVAPVKVAFDDVYLFYQSYAATTTLRAIRWDGSTWTTLGCIGEPFESGDILAENASAVKVGGQPHVTYWDQVSTTFGDTHGVAHTFFDGTTWRTSMVGIDYGAPTVSIDDGGHLGVFVGDATTAFTTTFDHDLLFISPDDSGIPEPPDLNCS